MGMFAGLLAVTAASQAVGAAITSGIPSALTVSMPGVSMTGVSNGIDGQRADGGPVWRDGRFLVGERGPEIFVPKADGMILPNPAMAAMRSPALPCPAGLCGRV